MGTRWMDRVGCLEPRRSRYNRSTRPRPIHCHICNPYRRASRLSVHDLSTVLTLSSVIGHGALTTLRASGPPIHCSVLGRSVVATVRAHSKGAPLRNQDKTTC
eukprot:2186959-Prymnesium_polylepis.1